MELKISVNDIKSEIFFEFLELFKKDGILKEYKVLHNDYEKEILYDIKNFHKTLEDVKNSKGVKTDKYIELEL